MLRCAPRPGAASRTHDICNLFEACSAIALPKNDYPLWDSVGDDIIDSGKLSRLQLEGVRYACSKHLEILPTGQRAGFFIGDGAGVGKGRQIAGAHTCSLRACKLATCVTTTATAACLGASIATEQLVHFGTS